VEITNGTGASERVSDMIHEGEKIQGRGCFRLYSGKNMMFCLSYGIDGACHAAFAAEYAFRVFDLHASAYIAHDIYIHGACPVACAASYALFAGRPDFYDAYACARLHDKRDGTQYLAESASVIEDKSKRYGQHIIYSVSRKHPDKLSVADIIAVDIITQHEHQVGGNDYGDGKHKKTKAFQSWIDALSSTFYGKPFKDGGGPAGPAAETASPDQRPEYLCYRIMDEALAEEAHKDDEQHTFKLKVLAVYHGYEYEKTGQYHKQ